MLDGMIMKKSTFAALASNLTSFLNEWLKYYTNYKLVSLSRFVELISLLVSPCSMSF